jgi:hypothetical protein
MKHRFVFVFLLTCALAGCRAGETRMLRLASVPSPEGERIAYLYRKAPPGGVFSDFVFEVSIHSAGDKAAPWEGGEVAWSGRFRPSYIIWTNETSMEVLLGPGNLDTSSFRTPSLKYEVTTRQLETTLKSEVVGSPGIAER